MNLSDLSDKELCELFRNLANGHRFTDPPRLQFLHEIQRRGERILDAIGWPRDDQALYCNNYVGSLNTYAQIVGYHLDHLHRPQETRDAWVFTLLEHWQPYTGRQQQLSCQPAGTQLGLLL